MVGHRPRQARNRGDGSLELKFLPERDNTARKSEKVGALRRSVLLVAALAAAAMLAVGFASPARAYGGGASHDTWQVGLSFNCNNPSFCGADGLGGGWGWVEFDRFADGSITGDAQTTGAATSAAAAEPSMRT